MPENEKKLPPGAVYGQADEGTDANASSSNKDSGGATYGEPQTSASQRKLPEGATYGTASDEQSQADDKIWGTGPVTISAAPKGVGPWLESAENDLKYGGESTLVGKIAHKIGLPGINRGTSESAANLVGGVVEAPIHATEAGHELVTGHPVRAVNKTIQTIGDIALPVSAAAPEVLPLLAPRMGGAIVGSKLGSAVASEVTNDPDYQELISNAGGAAGAGLPEISQRISSGAKYLPTKIRLATNIVRNLTKDPQAGVSGAVVRAVPQTFPRVADLLQSQVPPQTAVVPEVADLVHEYNESKGRGPVEAPSPIGRIEYAEPTERAITPAQIIGKRTAKPRTPGAPIELGFNHEPATDLGHAARQATEKSQGPMPRGERRAIPRTPEQQQTQELFGKARKELGEDASSDAVMARVEELKKEAEPKADSKGVPEVADLVNKYNESKGRGPVQAPKPEANPRGKEIADAYEAMEHSPSDPKVKASYDALKKTVDEQWDHAVKNGFKFEPTDTDPYKNSKEMREDVRNNKRLSFFKTDPKTTEMPADHPMLEVDPKTGLTYNDKFRAVHDLYGHAAHGNEFGAGGEEAAFKIHAATMPKEAIPALAAETRGQNNWVNFGKHLRNAAGEVPKKGEEGFVEPKNRPYAQQKAGMLPEEFHNDVVVRAGGGTVPENLINEEQPAQSPLGSAVSALPVRSQIARIADLAEQGLGGKSLEPKVPLRSQPALREALQRLSGKSEADVNKLSDDEVRQQLQDRHLGKFARANGEELHNAIPDTDAGDILRSKIHGLSNVELRQLAINLGEDMDQLRVSRAKSDAGAITREEVFNRLLKKYSPEHIGDAIDNAWHKGPRTVSGGSQGAESGVSSQREATPDIIHEPLIPEDRSIVQTSIQPKTLLDRWGVSSRSLGDTDEQTRGFNPKESAAYIDALARRYKTGAPVEPLIEIRDSGNNLIEANGRHRALAAQKAGLERIPIIVRRGVGFPGASLESYGVTDLIPEESTPAQSHSMPRIRVTDPRFLDQFGNPSVSGGSAATGPALIPSELPSVSRTPPSELQEVAPREKTTDIAGGQRVGQRVPTSVKAAGGHNPDLGVGMEAVRQAAATNPEYLNKLAAKVDYPAMRYEKGLTAEAKLNSFIKQAAANVEWLHNQVPENTREVTRRWYDSAHNMTKQWARDNGLTPEQTAGVTAVLSPQNPWENNVALAQRVIDAFKNRQDFDWTPEMSRVAKEIGAQSEDLDKYSRLVRGQKLSELQDPDPREQSLMKAMWIRIFDEAHNPRTFQRWGPDGKERGIVMTASGRPASASWFGLKPIAKAVSVLQDGSMENIHKQLGYQHKVRNFYNNIIDPNSRKGDVTIDTHAVGAAHLSPVGLSSAEVLDNFGGPGNADQGLNGTYPLYAEAYRRAAAKVGLKPRELQSITWEAVRSLFTNKSPELQKQVGDIWRQYRTGKISANQARQQIVKAAGGFKKPDWQRNDQ